MFERTSRASFVLAALAVQTLAPAFAATWPSDMSPAAPPAAERFGALPMRFEPNVGQFDREVEFVARGGGYTLSLSPGESVFALQRGNLARRRGDAEAQRPMAEPSVVRTRLVGANTGAPGKGVDPLPGVTNYFLGNDPSRWRTGIVSYAAVRYGEVYPGVDLVYYGNGRELEYDFVVSPGADPSAIRMQVEGAERITVDEAGDLVLTIAGGGELRHQAPVIYQESPAGRERVSGGYAVRGDTVTFAVGAYDPTRPLVLDPVLAYTRVLAFGFDDYANAIAVGADGSVYVAGSTNAPGSIDAFVAKLAASGGELVYVSYIGGDSENRDFGSEHGHGIAVGADGSAYVTGWTNSANFPTMAPLQAMFAGPNDAFVTKLSPSGASLVYSTYLGGSGGDGGSEIAVGADGSAYVAGGTSSANFPTMAPLQPMLAGLGDAFVTKLSPSGASLVYSTYLGGSGVDGGQGIAVGADGSAYVTGGTSSANFPTAAPHQAMSAGNYDAFVTKIAPSGTSLTYSTYHGGSAYDYGYGIAVGADGSAYVTGTTQSTNFHTAAPVHPSYAGFGDAYVTKLSPSGSSLVYSTYLGGSGGDYGLGIALAADGSAYVAGNTDSPDFPTAAPVRASLAGPSDNFVTKLSASGGTLVYSTYLGSEDYENAFTAIAVGTDGSAYVASSIGNFEKGGLAAVVMKITPGTATTPGVYVPSTGSWFLRNANSPGVADLVFGYGAGNAGYLPLAGDWDGDGIDTVGLYNPSTGAFFLKNANTPGAADIVFAFGAGNAGYVPLSGDWDGDGIETVGLYAPATGAFFLRNANASGAADIVFAFGAGGAGLVPIAGDWDGDGDTTVGLYNPATGAFFLTNAHEPGPAAVVFAFGAGNAGYVPIAGDWDGDGRDTVGLALPSTGTFFLRNANASGVADLSYSYGPAGATPIVGDWDGL
jgi:hypothetical protein